MLYILKNQEIFLNELEYYKNLPILMRDKTSIIYIVLLFLFIIILLKSK